MSKTGRPALIDERLFIPFDLSEARDLYAALLESGTPLSQARSIVTWLITLPEKRSEDPSTDSVRRDYRRRLQALGEPPWGGDGRANTWAHISAEQRHSWRSRRRARKSSSFTAGGLLEQLAA